MVAACRRYHRSPSWCRAAGWPRSRLHIPPHTLCVVVQLWWSERPAFSTEDTRIRFWPKVDRKHGQVLQQYLKETNKQKERKKERKLFLFPRLKIFTASNRMYKKVKEKININVKVSTVLN